MDDTVNTSGAVQALLTQLLSAVEAVRSSQESMRTEQTRMLLKLEHLETRDHAAESARQDHETRLRALESAPDVPADLETRVRALEKLAWKLVGAFALLNILSVLIEWWLWAHH